MPTQSRKKIIEVLLVITVTLASTNVLELFHWPIWLCGLLCLITFGLLIYLLFYKRIEYTIWKKFIFPRKLKRPLIGILNGKIGNIPDEEQCKGHITKFTPQDWYDYLKENGPSGCAVELIPVRKMTNKYIIL
ncbi:MAG: hypothetical protein HWN69_10125 [Desulfobacterales bacterium]|nr:hypothetical protein [Desulfobacterales bacterium]